MKIGYACLNWSLGCQANKTFRLASFSAERFAECLDNNLACLMRILEWNAERNLMFFRISSESIPFAAHPVNTVDWRRRWAKAFRAVGDLAMRKGFRISMHPDQFVLINTPKEDILKRSVADLEYHCDMLDLMELDDTAKVQIHVGGVYGDKKAAMERFCRAHEKLPKTVRRRLVIENDDRLFSLADTLAIHAETGVPVLFDNFHHECLNQGETMRSGMAAAGKTWGPKDGTPMIDYSHQEPGARMGNHAKTLEVKHLRAFLTQTKGLDADIMLEIKDKEASALRAEPLVRR